MKQGNRVFLYSVFLIILTLAAGASLSALDISEGRIKLVLHENIGKFSAYYLSDIKEETYTPLFLDQDPRTTSLSIIVGNRVYRMGESSTYRQSVEKTENGARFVWRSSSVEVFEEFEFAYSPRSPIADGFSITITIRNISEQNLTAEARYIFDTYLGEEGETHFQTDKMRRVTGETAFTRYSIPRYVLSPYDEDFGGFQIVTNQNGITVPDKLVLANWKRLNDSSWDYSASSNRNFNNLPYSINDSGIALYYDGKTIPPDGKMEITMAMGKYSPNGYNMSSNIGSSELTDVFDASLKNTPEDGGDVVLSVETDLITINDFINRVNKRLERGEEITDEEMEILNQVIQELSERKQLYEGD